MKKLKINISEKVDFHGLFDSLMFRIETLNPFMLIGSGAVALILVAALFLMGGSSQSSIDAKLARAEQVIGQVSGLIQNYNRVLEDQQVQELAVIAAADPDKLSNLRQYISGRIPDLIEIELFGTDLDALRAADLAPFGYAVLDMLLVASDAGQASVQIHGSGAESYMAMAVRIGDQDSVTGYLLVKVSPDALVSTFASAWSESGVFMLDQNNGRFKPTMLSNLSQAPSSSRAPGLDSRAGDFVSCRVCYREPKPVLLWVYYVQYYS